MLEFIHRHNMAVFTCLPIVMDNIWVVMEEYKADRVVRRIKKKKNKLMF